MATIDNSYLLSLFTSSSSSGSALTSLLTASTTSSSSSSVSTKDPTPPWGSGSGQPQASDLVKTVIAGSKFINESSAKLDVTGSDATVDADYKKMFALYQGLSALRGLAGNMTAKKVSSLELLQTQEAFNRGLKEVSSYMSGLDLSNLDLIQGTATASQTTTTGTGRENDTYLGGVIYQGAASGEVPAFQGDVAFTLTAKKYGNLGSATVDFDLSDMGSTPRTMSNVVAYMNGKLKDAGVQTRFAVNDIAGVAKTVTVGKSTVTLPTPADSYGLKLVGSSTETVTFGAADTSDAIYLTQRSGAVQDTDKSTTTTDDDDAPLQQLLKVNLTDPDSVTAQTGTANAIDGQVFTATLDSSVQSVRSTAAGPDGSVYVLANVNGAVSGQGIQGAADVAVQKYDSAGKLLWTQTLGAAASATGLSMAVSSTGQVAIAGSVTGALTGAQSDTVAASAVTPSDTSTDSFVTLLAASGDEVWSDRTATYGDDQANAVAFGEDGALYVAGATTSALAGQAALGGTDGYLKAYDLKSGALKASSEFGSSGADKATSIAVQDGQVVVAGTENGHAVVRSFSSVTGDDGKGGASVSLTAGGVRDLGDLGGGNVVGVAISDGKVLVAGNSKGGYLAAGTTTRAYTAGSDGFVASLDDDLAAASDDRLTYYGGAGADTVTAMAVSDGKVWLAGSAGLDLPGTTQIGKAGKDGFLTQIDPETGAIGYSQRLTGADAESAPESIVVAKGASSVLDQLGLPTGTLSYTSSPLVTSATSLRAGDQFTLKVGSVSRTVTIEAADTMATLATKISRASGFNATVTTTIANKQNQIEIEPAKSSAQIELIAGPSGKDALSALGLTAGVIRDLPQDDATDANKVVDNAAKKTTTTTANPVWGLGLSSNLSLSTTDGVTASVTILDKAMQTLRDAYRKLATKNDPTTTSTSGTVPAYLTAQIANYQAALARLTGSS